MKQNRPRRRLNHDDKAQSRAFIQAARDIGTDDASSVDEVMARLASMPPETHNEALKRQAKKSKAKPGT